jgi:hypothetical protein
VGFTACIYPLALFELGEVRWQLYEIPLGKIHVLNAESRAETDFAGVTWKILLKWILYNRVVDRTEIVEGMSNTEYS